MFVVCLFVFHPLTYAELGGRGMVGCSVFDYSMSVASTFQDRGQEPVPEADSRSQNAGHMSCPFLAREKL